METNEKWKGYFPIENTRNRERLIDILTSGKRNLISETDRSIMIQLINSIPEYLLVEASIDTVLSRPHKFIIRWSGINEWSYNAKFMFHPPDLFVNSIVFISRDLITKRITRMEYPDLRGKFISRILRELHLAYGKRE